LSKMANKRFRQTEVLDRIAADSDSEVVIESEDDGWPSYDDESSDVDNVHNVEEPDFILLRPRIAHEPGRGERQRGPVCKLDRNSIFFIN
jgi:hypothetical protein